MIIFALILLVLFFKISGAVLKIGFRMLGIGIALAAFLILSPLLGLLAMLMPLIYIAGIFALVFIIVRAVRSH